MASGLGGLIGVGRTQKQQALAGLTKAAQLETQTDIANMQLEAQKEAAIMNVAGTVGGIAVAQKMLARKAGEALVTEAAKTTAANVAGGTAAAAGGTAAAAGGTAAAAGGTAATTAAAGGAAASGGAMAAIGAAAPYVLLAIAGGYLLKKIFD